ncbi:uncharacterized protein LOC124170199 [Ischnura elegans]|uniref:uncharacterized protein LOC124170199 n=1 Tax=Ischnura elegans TaxID=197161 RepID=UPI001ED8A34D|nr:uncharacterized protein LOC124170199 [Ischnura elegans]
MVKYTRCSVYGCGVRNLQFFHFPRNVQRAEKWRHLAGNPTLYAIPLDKLHHKASVCKRHFTRDQFTNTKLDRLNLNAFPSLHLPPPCDPPPEPPVTTAADSNKTEAPPVVAPPVLVESGPTPVLHYVVFPSVNPSAMPPPPPVEIPDDNKACVAAGEEMAFTAGQSSSVEVPPSSFELLTQFCEATEGGADAVKDCEEDEAPMDGHYKYTLCRLCFSTLDIITTDIFSMDKGRGYVIKDVIEDLLQFKVSKMDEYPQFICVSCLNKLTEFWEFKEKILKDKAVFEEALRKLKQSAAEGEGLAEDEVANVDPGICPTDFVQLISFDPSNGEIDVGVPNNAPEVIEQSGMCGVKRQCSSIEEDLTDLLTATRDLAHPEVLCATADRLTASVEEPAIGPELVIRRELNTGVMGDEGRRWLADHLAKVQRKGPLRKNRLLYECRLCNKRFKKQQDLDKHLVVHAATMSRTEQCARCGVVLKAASALQNGKPRSAARALCAVCVKAFGEGVANSRDSQSSLKLNSASGEESERREFNVDILVMKDSSRLRGGKFGCRQCGKSFPLTEILERHMRRSHLSKRRFRCEHCDERFTLKRCLHDHAKRHARGMS